MTATLLREISLTVETVGKRAGEIFVGIHKLYDHQISQLPGVHYDSRTDHYTIPRTWNSILSLSALAKELRCALAPDPEIKAWAGQQAKAWAELRKLSKVVRKGERAGTWFLHQEDGAAWLNAAPEAGVGRLLQDQTGSGKTGTIIKALLDAKVTGPILITCPENVMNRGWVRNLDQFAAADYRVVEITGAVTARRKKIAALAAGEFDIGIIGHSNLTTHTRFESYGNSGLRRCIACGGPRLTTGQVDEKGNPLPDIDYHADVKVVGLLDPDEAAAREREPGWYTLCRHDGCAWTTGPHETEEKAGEEAAAHSLTGRKISEITPAQCQRHSKELNEITFSRIIVDEIHRAMNPRNQFTQAIWGLALYGPEPVPPEHRWGLTGSPVSKRSEQAWAPLHFIGPDNWPTKSSWVDYFCVEETNWAGFREIKRIKPERLDEFQATYSAVTRRVLKEQVLDLPPLLRWNGLERRLTLSGKQKAAYAEMKKKMQLAVDGGLVTVSNAAQLAGRLSMMATGTGVPDPANRPGSPQRMLLETPSSKLDAIIADFRSGDFDDAQVGMMFASLRSLRMIQRGLIEAKIATGADFAVIAGDMTKRERDLAIEQFQSGKRRISMFTYAAGAEGITLTAASYALAVERSWNPIHNVQGVERFHRIGSEIHECVTVIDYIVDGTNEVAQLNRMSDDAETLEQIVQDRKRLAEWFA